jgi:hypothetical protein
MGFRLLQMFNNVNLKVFVNRLTGSDYPITDLSPGLAGLIQDHEKRCRPLLGQRALRQMWRVKAEAGVTKVRHEPLITLDVARQIDTHTRRCYRSFTWAPFRVV